MPRTKLDKPKYPPIDWLMAAILERKKVMGLEWNDLADMVGGISGDYLRKLVSSKPPMKWPDDVRNKVCRKLGINIRMVVEDDSDREARI